MKLALLTLLLALASCRSIDDLRGMNEARDRENLQFSVNLFRLQESHGFQPYQEPIYDTDGSIITYSRFTGRTGVYYWQYGR